MNIEDFQEYENHPKKKSYKFKLIKIRFSRLVLSKVLKEKGVLKCAYCPNTRLRIQWNDNYIRPSEKATIDHVEPVSKGGKHFDLRNLVVSCDACNSRKSDKSLNEFLSCKKK